MLSETSRFFARLDPLILGLLGYLLGNALAIIAATMYVNGM